MKNYNQVYVKNSVEAAKTYCEAFGAEITRVFLNEKQDAYEHAELSVDGEGFLALAGILTVIMDQSMMLTGVLDENSVILHGLKPENPLDLRAIIFASIIIGAVGAIMDVSISIAAALAELKEKVPDIGFKELLQSGMTISRDIMGTMANTLILAYIGGFMSGVLLMVAYNSSMLDLFNREMIVVECLQSLVGSLGILMTLPFTSLICAVLFRGSGSRVNNQQNMLPAEERINQ